MDDQNKELAKAFGNSIVKMMAIKWTVIIVTTRVARKMAKKYAEES